jgi:hypothetical protein
LKKSLVAEKRLTETSRLSVLELTKQRNKESATVAEYVNKTKTFITDLLKNVSL